MTERKPLALVGVCAPKEIISRLTYLGFKALILEADTRLPSPVSSHADMLAFPLGDRIFCSREYAERNREVFDVLSKYGYVITKCDCNIGNKYPEDIPFNLALIDEKIYGRLDSSAKEIIIFAEQNKIGLVSVKQGYTKCSTLVLGNKAVVTADEGIALSAQRNGISVLKIKNSPSAVSIDGYDYGFLGGACGVFEDTVYFTGNLSAHPDGAEIAEFCRTHSYKTVDLGDQMLTDVGGIIFLEALN